MINEKVETFLNAPLDSINFGDIYKSKIKDDTLKRTNCTKPQN